MLIVVLSLVVNAGCVADHRSNHLVWEQSRIFDLTHSFGSDTIVWPTEQDFKLIVQHAEDTAGGYYYSSNRMDMPEQNLANLHDLPARGFDVIALPMKIAAGTGGPLRVIAVVPAFLAIEVSLLQIAAVSFFALLGLSRPIYTCTHEIQATDHLSGVTTAPEQAGSAAR
jgi:hypothetical protein